MIGSNFEHNFWVPSPKFHGYIALKVVSDKGDGGSSRSGGGGSSSTPTGSEFVKHVTLDVAKCSLSLLRHHLKHISYF